MRSYRVAISTALLVALGSLTALPPAHAATGVSLYVNNDAAVVRCSDTTTPAASSVTPYCTIQAAVDVAQPGDTVVVTGQRFAPFAVTTSGTVGEPITIRSESAAALVETAEVESTGSQAAITLSGASYVNLDGFVAVVESGPAVLITGSSHIVVDSGYFATSGSGSPQPLVHVTGNSSAVTVSRDMSSINGAQTVNSAAGFVRIDGGGSGDVVTTNQITGNPSGPGIVVDGVPDVAVTSNTVKGTCGAGIEISHSSTQATVENNLVSGMVSSQQAQQSCAVAADATRGLAVDGSSTTSSVVDYNIIDSSNAGVSAMNYTWAADSYGSAADLFAATGQGRRDLNGLTAPNPAALSGSSSTAIDSANADAPGELPTDYAGKTRLDDPVVADTGSGTHTYYDRGASETRPGVSAASFQWFGPNGSLVRAPVGSTLTLSGNAADLWGAVLTCQIDFGDGTTASVTESGSPTSCSTTHQYTATGSYTAKMSVAFSDGTKRTVSRTLTIGNPAPLVPAVSASALSSLIVRIGDGNTTSGWSIVSEAVDYGDGTSLTCCFDHAYARPGTYTITLTATDAGGNTAKTSVPFSTLGDFYTPVVPTRILDTRNGTGTGAAAKVPANGTVKLKVAGAGALPATGVDAVALNVTVTSPAAGGYITVYPDGSAKPTASSLNFTPGQTIPNTVIVKVGADGEIDLTNTSAGTAELVADVEGYYGLQAADGFTGLTPNRVLDTRTNHAALPANGTTRVYFGQLAGVSAVTLNLTAVNAKQSGYITAYPDGSSLPKASNVNFAQGLVTQNEAIVKVGADGYVDFTNTSGASVDLIVDLTGYFGSGPGFQYPAAFVPLAPTRVLDTRTDSQGALQPFATRSLPLLGKVDLRQGYANLVAANVTVTHPTASGYLTAFATETDRPTASVLNFSPGQTVPNATIAYTGLVNSIDFYNGSNGTVDLIVDVYGYYN